MAGLPSLSAFFEAKFLPLFLVGDRPATIRLYRFTIAKWKRHTGDPPIDQVDNLVLAEFRARLAEYLAPATVNKELRHVNAMLGKAGPAGPRNRDALGLIDRVPWVRPLAEDRELPRVVEFELLDRVYAACAAERWPEGLEFSPAAWWRALIVLALVTGYRHGVLLALRWSDVDLHRRTIRVSARGDKCHRGRQKPLHAVAVSHLMKIRSTGERVFPWPYSEGWWYQRLHAIQEAAGVEREQRFGLHDLKRTCGTLLGRAGDPWVVQTMLDHSSLNTSRFYVNATAATAAAVAELPLPSSFLPSSMEAVV